MVLNELAYNLSRVFHLAKYSYVNNVFSGIPDEPPHRLSWLLKKPEAYG